MYTDKTEALLYAGVLTDHLCRWPLTYTAKYSLQLHPSFKKNKTQLSRIVGGIQHFPAQTGVLISMKIDLMVFSS